MCAIFQFVFFFVCSHVDYWNVFLEACDSCVLRDNKCNPRISYVALYERDCFPRVLF